MTGSRVKPRGSGSATSHLRPYAAQSGPRAATRHRPSRPEKHKRRCMQRLLGEPSSGLEPETPSLPSRLFPLFAGTRHVSRVGVLQDFRDSGDWRVFADVAQVRPTNTVSDAAAIAVVSDAV